MNDWYDSNSDSTGVAPHRGPSGAPGAGWGPGVEEPRDPGAVDADEAAAFLRCVFPDPEGRIELRCIGDAPPRSLWADSVAQAFAHLGQVETDVNVSVGVAERRAGATQGRKSDLLCTSAVWVDLDPTPGADPDDWRMQTLDRVAAFLIPATIIADSGNGIHVYWALSEPAPLETPAQRDAFEQVTRGLAHTFDADACWDCSRVMRVPGTLNFPDAKKRRLGREVQRCTVLELDESRTYSLDTFDRYRAPANGTSGNGQHDVQHFGPWPPAPPSAETMALIHAENVLRARYERDAFSLRDSSASGVDFSLASLLAIREVDVDEIVRVLYASRADHDANPRRHPPGWYYQTAQKALDSVVAPSRVSVPERADDAPPTLTDAGNAERLVQQHGADLLHFAASKKWYVWDGHRFAPDDKGEIVERAKATARSLYAEASRCDTTEQRGKVAAWATKSEAEPRIRAMIALAQSDPRVAVTADDLDRDRFALNVLNGTIDLRTGELRPHDRGDRITMLAPATYDPDVQSQMWQRFLDRVLPDREVQGFVQRYAGYSLTADVSEEVLVVQHGSGANGKTTLVETLRHVIGDYATHSPAETLMVRRSDAPSADVARLRGARFITVTESEEGARLAEARVKALTGGDRVTARFLHAQFFEFSMTGKLWLSTNHKPTVKGGDEAIWRRIRLVPFEQFIPPEERDPDLKDRLRDEAPAVLAWCVRGCLKWIEHGLDPPDAVIEATRGYREEEDPVSEFLEESCVIHPDAFVRASSLYAAYEQWSADQRRDALSQKSFGERLSRRPGFQRGRLNGAKRPRAWFGLGLLADEDAFTPAGRTP